MATLIKYVRHRNIVEFDEGSFDRWCVYLTRHEQARYAPRDTEYFSRLKDLGQKHTRQKIYDHFVIYYKYVTKNINNKVLDLITRMSDTYNDDAEEIDVWFSVIYGGMIAEENKANAVLKKRIKRLGMHQVLIEDLDPDYAANFSKGKRWWELDAIMKQKGF